MATTPNLGLTLLEIGQKNKETTINDDLTLIDTKLTATNTAVATKSAFLGTGTADPAPVAGTVGSFFYRTDLTKLRIQINATTWANA